MTSGLPTSPPAFDPYRGCEDGCSHDLAKGVLTSELLGGDGPFDLITYPTQPPLMVLWNAARAATTEETDD
jgi:hypothetical protein